MKAEYVTLLTVFASIVSGWGGAFIAGYFSRKASTDAIDKEREIRKDETRKKSEKNLIKLYTYLIKIDYGKEVFSMNSGGFSELDMDIYNNHIRDAIYEKYHLVHESVIKHFNKIEKTNQKLMHDQFYSGSNEMIADIDAAAEAYRDMIKEIKRILDKERMN